MRTSIGGCPDWIYTKGVMSRLDEKVVDAGFAATEGATDHNGIIVTLRINNGGQMEPVESLECRRRLVRAFGAHDPSGDGSFASDTVKSIMVELGMQEDDVQLIFTQGNLVKDGKIDYR